MKLKYLDTAGEEDYQNMIDMWLSFAEGFLLVFTIDNKESFENIKTSRELILRYKKKFPMKLVGNNVELENERKVSYKEAKDLANSWGIEYFETSAKTGFNVKEVFEKLIQEIIADKKEKHKNKKCIII